MNAKPNANPWPGDITDDMLEVGMWVLAGYIAPGELPHVDQTAMLRSVYHAMRITEGSKRPPDA